MQPPLVIKQGGTSGQVSMQPGIVTVPMTVNSSMPGVMALNKTGANNVVVTSQNLVAAQPTIIPNVQILNMRPGTPAVATQKIVTTMSPRVVIGTPQMVGARASAPGITLQTLQGLQPGQQGHLLLKTENGHYQLLRVGPVPTAGTLAAPHAQAVRLSTVPALSGVPTVSTSTTGSELIAGQLQVVPAPAITPAPVPSPAPVPTPAPTPQVPIVTTRKPSDNTKEKCRNFLANLLDLSSKEPKSVEMSVRNLIQELIDSQVEPEEFCDRLERLLNASPQPCLIGFLKKSLPLLRQSLVTKELVIEGINPPAAHIAFPTVVIPAQQVVTANNQLLSEEEDSSSTLTPLLPPAIPVSLPLVHSPKPLTAVPVQIANFQSCDDECSSPTLTPLLPPVLPVTLTPALDSSPKPITLLQVQPTGTAQKATTKSGTIAVLQNIPVHQKLNLSKVAAGKTMTINKANFTRPVVANAALSTIITPGKSLLKEKEKKSSTHFLLPFIDDKLTGDDDINDVAAMGGVNLAEETQRILGSTELIGTNIRSCKDEQFIPTNVMQARLKTVCTKHGLDDPSSEVASLMSHAVHEYLKNMVEKLVVIAQHRIDPVAKSNSRYEVSQDVKGQLRFLEELDRSEKKRREDSEREMLLRAAKSRSKTEDPEQAKLKAKAKEMQRVELEEVRQREANLTALQAIGPRKKPRLEGPTGDSGAHSATFATGGFSGRSQMPMRTRVKRINYRDMLFLLEQEKETSHSLLLYKSYLK